MSESEFLNMDDIAEAKDTEYDVIDVPEWGGKIRVGSLDAEQMIDFIEANEGPSKKTAGIRLIVNSLVDGDGKRIGTPKDINRLKPKSAKVINRIAMDLLKLNGLGEEARRLAKNASSEAPTDASPSD